MLSLFPGRTLEELDNMDWFRLLRALEVKSIGEIEKINLSYIQGITKFSSITGEQWKRILEHNEIVNGK